MKIIFLDVDGVLNHQAFYESGKWQKGKMRDIDPKSMELLNMLIEETGAKIVLSSAWRIGRTIEELQQEFNELGLKGNIIGKTPGSDKNYFVRGNEIYAWLLNQGRKEFNLDYGFKNYVIIDDSTDMLLQQKDNFVWVDNFVGLTLHSINKAKKILNTVYVTKEIWEKK
jgi:hypothetical protein